MRSSHSLERLSVDFSDTHAVAGAGLLLPATLAGRLRLKELLDEHVALGAGSTAAVLGGELRAPSTLGTFPRSFTFGHARQLDAVSRRLLARAWGAGAGPGEAPFTIDLDSTICETYGVKKQGGSKFTYAKVRGYHPLLAVAARSGEVLNRKAAKQDWRWKGSSEPRWAPRDPALVLPVGQRPPETLACRGSVLA